MADFATTDDLAGFLQQEVNEDTAELVLSLVRDEILEVAGITDDTLLPASSRAIALRAAARIYSNPTGDKSVSIDDYRRELVATDGLLTDAERALLATTAGNPSAAFTIRPTYVSGSYAPDPWVTL